MGILGKIGTRLGDGRKMTTLPPAAPEPAARPRKDEQRELALPGPTGYSLAILRGLNVGGKHVYAGTVPKHVVARRRTKNKVARKTRRVSRQRAQ